MDSISWSAGAFTITQTAYLFKLVIPATNALPHWRLNVETRKKRTLHNSRWLSCNELTNTSNLVLQSSLFLSVYKNIEIPPIQLRCLLNSKYNNCFDL
jgi:hypothetical protein